MRTDILDLIIGGEFSIDESTLDLESLPRLYDLLQSIDRIAPACSSLVTRIAAVVGCTRDDAIDHLPDFARQGARHDRRRMLDELYLAVDRRCGDKAVSRPLLTRLTGLEPDSLSVAFSRARRRTP